MRPLSAWLSCLGSDLTWRQVLFIGAIAPRGVVAVPGYAEALAVYDGPDGFVGPGELVVCTGRVD